MEILYNCVVLKLGDEKLILQDNDRVDLTLKDGNVFKGFEFRYDDSEYEDIAFSDSLGKTTVVVDVSEIKEIKWVK